MDHIATGPILVGYDGSPDARAALGWAIREAASRHLSVRVVYAEVDLTGIDTAAVALVGAQSLTAALPPIGAEVVAEGIAQVQAAGVQAEGAAVTGSSAVALVEASRDAGLVVIGSRGLGSVSSAILGSTVAHVASHAHCPVIVVRSEGVPDGPVVVGIDGSPASEAPLRWALDHASRHGLALEVVHAYAIPVYPGVVPYVPPVGITRATADFEDRVVHEALAGWRERYPDVPVTTTLVHGRPATVLAEASARASLVVVGSRGRGAFLGMLLGSTSQALLHHAKGSVAILRHRRHEPEEPPG